MSGETKQPTWQDGFDNNIRELRKTDDENDNRAVMEQIKENFENLLGRIQEENANRDTIKRHIDALTNLYS